MRYLLWLIPLFLYSCFSLQKNSFGTPEQADILADKIMAATHQESWKKTTIIQWTFDAANRAHIWDRKRKFEHVKWGDTEVWLNLATKKGVVKIKGKYITEDRQEYLDKAWKYWINDSFWLNPIAKFYDEGVTRSLVKVDKKDTALLVSYSQGGETPGDSYLWLVDENYKPKAWKLWVSIIPINGYEFSWENWQTLKTDLMISTLHKSSLKNVNLSNVKGSTSTKELFGEEDPFDELFDD